MTSTLARTVRTATMDDMPGVARALGRSFHDDPLFRWLFPDPLLRISQTTRANALLAGFTFVPLGYSALVEAQEDPGRGPVVRGAALWTPPGWDGDTASSLRSLPHWAELVSPGRFPEVLRYFAAVTAHAPAEPHWHLQVLGADPAVPRTGVGSLLLRAGLERADAEGSPVYLETMNPDNLAFYTRFGFEAVDTVDAPEGPTAHLMLRRPA